ncbi:TrbM/KikA/MpfK family conjugal transfer protein [Advenella alkanexedens]|uniref:TrbM/KikA/MpfK family conjugal transfer protein n=1 Tax=Advenella alkanexedens TaxID=1481665 RepID=UPI00267492CB|nr:TrbM/KikA/MpfK family conjugal transfer protein [Advenella alkanexedens]WKU18725.1 TrbM/KikA/MpfK family conjugal transfer protein [Advenella alkanexedens]
MKLPAIAGKLALCCVSLSANAQTASVLGGTEGLACEAILCLSSSLQPGECNPSLNHYFDIKKYSRGVLDWSATIDARRAFLGMCPSASAPGMSERINAISRGAGKCDPEYLNRTYAGTSYKYQKRRDYFTADNDYVYSSITTIKTVTQNKLPAYCVAYVNHDWTYDLSIKYVGTPLKGGYWVKASQYDAAQAKWEADHNGQWAKQWEYAWKHPVNGNASENNRYDSR